MSVNVFPVDAVAGAPSYTGRQLRQLLAVLTGGGAGTRPLIGRSGVNPRTPTSTAAASTSTWTVHAHGGYVDAETSAASGGYFYSVDADVTGAMTAANASNPRIDLLYVQISDPAEADGSSVPAAAVKYLAGTAASSPVAPATPARSLALAQINVPVSGGGSPSVSWVAVCMAAAGGIVPVSGSSAYPPAPYVGQYIDDAALGLLRWNGTGWGSARADTGWVTTGIAPIGANTISGILLRRQGALVHLDVTVTLSAFFAGALSSGPTGNIANTSIATVTDARFIPAQKANGLSSGASGGLVSGSVDATGALIANAITPNQTFAAGDVLSFSGYYFAD